MSRPLGQNLSYNPQRAALLYGRIPRRAWEDRTFFNLSPSAKLLYCYIATSPIAAPRMTGCVKASPAIIAESLGPTYTSSEIIELAAELQAAGLLQVDWEGRLIWARSLYFPVNNEDWFLGRMREVANFPSGPVKDAILLHMLRVDDHYRQGDNPAYEEMELSGLLSAQILAVMSGKSIVDLAGGENQIEYEGDPDYDLPY